MDELQSILDELEIEDELKKENAKKKLEDYEQKQTKKINDLEVKNKDLTSKTEELTKSVEEQTKRAEKAEEDYKTVVNQKKEPEDTTKKGVIDWLIDAKE